MSSHRLSLRLLFMALTVALLGTAGCKSFNPRNLFSFLNKGKVAAQPALIGFEGVQIGPGLTADVSVGGAFAVTIDGDQTLVRQVAARVEKQDLIVTRTPPAGVDPAATPVHMRVVLPRLSRLQVDGARVTVAGAAGPQVEITAGTKATVNATALDTTKLLITGRDASRVSLAGTAVSLYVSLSGGSRGDARQLLLRNARVNLVEASRLDLKPEQAVSGKAAGGSVLAVWNKPKRVGVATRDASDVSYIR